jgi:hypothetical protein
MRRRGAAEVITRMDKYSFRTRLLLAVNAAMLSTLGFIAAIYLGAGALGFVIGAVALASIPRYIWPAGRATDTANRRRWALNTSLTTYLPETVAVVLLGLFVTWWPALVYLAIVAISLLGGLFLFARAMRRRGTPPKTP